MSVLDYQPNERVYFYECVSAEDVCASNMQEEGKSGFRNDQKIAMKFIAPLECSLGVRSTLQS